MVTRRGFEPLNASVKGWCVKPLHQRANNGAPNQTRTGDLFLTMEALYRLSYGSKWKWLLRQDSNL